MILLKWIKILPANNCRSTFSLYNTKLPRALLEHCHSGLCAVKKLHNYDTYKSNGNVERFRKMTYEKRLRALNLYSPQRRTASGDKINICKYLPRIPKKEIKKSNGFNLICHCIKRSSVLKLRKWKPKIEKALYNSEVS